MSIRMTSSVDSRCWKGWIEPQILRNEIGRSENAFVGIVAGVLIVSALIAKASQLNLSPLLTVLAIVGLVGFVGLFALIGHIIGKRMP